MSELVFMSRWIKLLHLGGCEVLLALVLQPTS